MMTSYLKTTSSSSTNRRSTAVIVALLITSSSRTIDAFVPVSQSSFVIRHEAVVMAPSSKSSMIMPPPIPTNRNINNHGTNLDATTATSSTALQMNLFDRFVRVTKGNMNKVLSSLEAPEKIMNQAVDDMQRDLLKIRQSYAEITASQRRLEKQRIAAESVAQDWYDRAQLALRKGEDGLAKAALTRRQDQLEIIKNLQAQIETQGVAMDKLYNGMLMLEGKIVEAKQKKQQFAARAKAAESTAKVNDMLSGMTGKTSMDAFNRMEEKVEALEAVAEASSEMVHLFPSDGTAGGGSEKLNTLENEFLLLEGSAAIDDELEKMKSKLLLGPSTTSTTTSKSIDPELEKLKKEYSRIPIKIMD